MTLPKPDWPLPIPKWFWTWASWYLGRDAFKGDARDAKKRPKNAPKVIPKWAWDRLAYIVHGVKPPAPPPPPKLTLGQKIVQAAAGEIGTKEYPSGSNLVKYSAWYGIVGPWCAMFVSWCLVQAGSTAAVRGKRWSFVPTLLEDARAGRNGVRVVQSPSAGCLCPFDFNGDGVPEHVGIFECWIDSVNFSSIEGNTAEGNDSNGGEVMRRTRPRGPVVQWIEVTQ